MTRQEGGLLRVVGFVVAFVVGEFGQNVCGVRIATRGETPKLIEVLPFAGELDEQVHGIRVAICREPAELLEVASLPSELDQLGHGIQIPS